MTRDDHYRAAHASYRKRRAESQAKDIERLRSLIPVDCPLTVGWQSPRYYVRTLDGAAGVAGRFQIVATYIEGFAACWRRVRRST